MVACSNPRQSLEPWLPAGFQYAYSLTIYYGGANEEKNFRYIEYYDSADRTLLKVGPEEGCLRFIYDTAGRLLEKRWGRDCRGSIRDSMVYDSRGNLIGSVTPKDSSNLTPPPFRQTKFYDNENRLVKEFVRDLTDINGKKLEFWREFRYSGGRISREIITQNGALEWDGTYEYDKNNRLLSIKKKRGHVIQNTFFKYNSRGKLVEEKRISNEYPITSDATYYAWNSSTLYEYDSTGFLVKVYSLSHKGDMDLVTEHIKKYNRP